jgi:hypothetical protein
LGLLFADEPRAAASGQDASATELLNTDRHSIEAERALLQNEIERFRQWHADIEQIRQRELNELQSERAELERLKREHFLEIQLQRDEIERLRVKNLTERVEHPASPIAEHGSILRIDPVGSPPPSVKGCSDPSRRNAPQRLRLMLDPGRANGPCIAEILSEVIALGRLSGIGFAKLEGRECVPCIQSRHGRPSSISTPIAARVAFELLLTAVDERNSGADDVQLWEQFEVSLRKVISMRHGLERALRQDVSTGGSRQFKELGQSSGGLSLQAAPSRATPHAGCEPGELPIALIDRQLQKIERLLRRAASDHGVRVELVGQNRKGHRRCDAAYRDTEPASHLSVSHGPAQSNQRHLDRL